MKKKLYIVFGTVTFLKNNFHLQLVESMKVKLWYIVLLFLHVLIVVHDTKTH